MKKSYGLASKERSKLRSRYLKLKGYYTKTLSIKDEFIKLELLHDSKFIGINSRILKDMSLLFLFLKSLIIVLEYKKADFSRSTLQLLELYASSIKDEQYLAHNSINIDQKKQSLEAIKIYTDLISILPFQLAFREFCATGQYNTGV